jgi:hypothetical protein
LKGRRPVVTITAADIKNNGFATVADVMTALTQNLGALDNNQNTDGFSPGAQAVDLRGLGPNHTLVLVNGRRIADYPQSYGGNSNFTDISNIPDVADRSRRDLERQRLGGVRLGCDFRRHQFHSQTEGRRHHHRLSRRRHATRRRRFATPANLQRLLE